MSQLAREPVKAGGKEESVTSEIGDYVDIGR
jgi:hypothetical protein